MAHANQLQELNARLEAEALHEMELAPVQRKIEARSADDSFTGLVRTLCFADTFLSDSECDLEKRMFFFSIIYSIEVITILNLYFSNSDFLYRLSQHTLPMGRNQWWCCLCLHDPPSSCGTENG